MKYICIILIVMMNFLLVEKMEACSCIYQGKIDIREFNDYDIIFKGKVISVNENEKGIRKIAKVKVKKSYKNHHLKDTIDISTMKIGSMCGINFIAGEEWLIYGYLSKGKYSTGLCTRSIRLSFFKKMKLIGEKRFLKKFRNHSGIIETKNASGELRNGKPIGKWVYKQNGVISETYQYSSDGPKTWAS